MLLDNKSSHLFSIDPFVQPFDPVMLVLDKKLAWGKASFFTKIFRRIQDIFCKEAKWVRLAHDIDRFCCEYLEDNKIIDHALYARVNKLCAFVRDNLKEGSSRDQVRKASSLMQRHIVALNFRAPTPASWVMPRGQPVPQPGMLKNSIKTALQKPHHFWAVDFHAPLNKSSAGRSDDWFEMRWNALAPEISQIPGLEALLLRDPDQLDAFILWALRDNCPVEVFAGFPGISDKLKATYVAARIGRASEFRKKSHLLKVERDKGSCFVSLKVEKSLEKFTRVPLLARKKFTMANKITMNAKGLAEALARRYDDYIPPVQFTQDGLRLFNTHLVAVPRYDEDSKKIINDPLPSGSSTAWWAALPAYETIPLAEAKRRCKGLDGSKPGLILHGTTEAPTVELTGNHGYVELLLPTADATYKVYSFGKSVEKAPHGMIETLKFFMNTVAARIACAPDQNEEFSNRENWGIGFALPSDDIDRIKDIVYEYVQRTNKEKVPYSLVGKNCHAFVAAMARKILLPTLAIAERTQMKRKIEALTMMDYEDRKHLPGFKNPMTNLLLKFLRGGKPGGVPFRLKVVAWLLGGWRRFSYKKDGRTKERSVLSAQPLAAGKFLCPAKMRLLVQDHVDTPESTPLEVYRMRNRIYVGNGMDFLKEVAV